jgi:hypothetical protein
VYCGEKMRQRIAIGLIVATALAAAAAVPAAAGAKTHHVDKALWGLLTMPDGSSPIPIYRKLGVDYLEYQLVWSRIAPTRPAHPKNPKDPAYHWPSDLDAFVPAARRKGIGTALMLKDTPTWANGGAGVNVAPDKDSDYAAFATAAARHYRSVRRWMIWGETNRAFTWQPLPANSPVGPRRYATLLRAGYWALKGVSKKNLVIGGMTFTFGDVYPGDFVRYMRLPNGKPPPLDMYGHNPFSRRRPARGQPLSYPGARDMGDVPRLVRDVHRSYRKLHRFRKHGPKLWLSEFTVSSDRANRAFNFAVSRKEQAAWLKGAFNIAYHTKQVAALGWFNLIDEDPSVDNGLTTGLLTYDGKPKPVFNVYRHAH